MTATNWIFILLITILFFQLFKIFIVDTTIFKNQSYMCKKLDAIDKKNQKNYSDLCDKFHKIEKQIK